MTVHIENSFMSYDPERAKSTLAALIEESVHYANCRFKVGMSYDPIHRVFGVSTRNGIPATHGRLNRTYRWQAESLTLFVLLKTFDYSQCQDAERDMIRILRDRVPPDQVMNNVGGGGGRKPSQAPYHVYLVRSG